MSYAPGIIDTAYDATGDVFSSAGGEAGYLAPPDVSAGPDIGAILNIGKGAFKYGAPQTYAGLTEWLPSFSEIGTSLGLDGLFGGGAAALEGGGVAAGSGLSAGAAGGMGALGGAMAAFGPAAIAYAVAQFLASIGDTGDTSMILGGGNSDDLGEFLPTYGRPDGMAGASALYNEFIGDRSWYGEGDTSLVDEMPVTHGLMSINEKRPFYAIGGMPYETPGLAINSGRQIAQGRMGLPVEHEALPTGFGPVTDPGLGQAQTDRSLPVWDAPETVPGDWDEWQRRAQTSSYGGGSNTEANTWAPELIEERVGQMTDRGQQFFNTSLTTDQFYAGTGPGSPDYAAIVGDLSDVQGSVDNLSPSGRSVPGYQWGTF